MENELSKKFKIEVPTRMQTLRANAKITQKQMAERLGVTKTYISNLERGVTKLPAHILYSYCEILHVSPNKMLGYSGDNQMIPDGYSDLSNDKKKLITDIINAMGDQ
jgi:transcriptional regulator with XRE-family HTH domain